MPLLTTNLLADYDVDALGLADGVDITNWYDQSGAGHTAFGLTSHKPVSHTGGPNGYRVASFDGNMRADTTDVNVAPSGTAQRTIFVVAKCLTASPPTSDYIWYGQPGTAAFGFGPVGGGHSVKGDFWGSNTSFVGVGNITLWHVLAIQVDSIGKARIWVDGVKDNAGNISVNTSAGYKFSIGGRGETWFDTPDGTFVGDIARVVVHGALTDGEIGTQSTYLKSVYIDPPVLSRAVPMTAALSVITVTNTRNVPTTSALSLTGLTRTVGMTTTLGLGRGVLMTVSLNGVEVRAVLLRAALGATRERAVPLTASLTGGLRSVPLSAAIDAPAAGREVPLTVAIAATAGAVFTMSTFFSAHGHLAYSARNAQQIIHLADTDGGQWTATFEGETTSSLGYNLSAAALQTALRALPSIDGPNVNVTGGPGTVKPFLLEFVGTLAQQPVGLVSTDSSSLTGPAGLTPRATVRSLAPGYSAADDYGLQDEVTWTSYRGNIPVPMLGTITDLSFDKADEGGDQTASCSIVFTPPYDTLPRVNDWVILSDKRGGFWGGLLAQPSTDLDGIQAQYKLTARGFYATAHDLHFAISRTFEVSTLVGEIFKVTRNELLARYFPAVDAYIAPGGIAITEETPDLFKGDAAGTFDQYGALGNGAGSAMVWGARLPPVDAPYSHLDPVLYYEPETIGPRYQMYLRDGVKVSVSWDADDIVNRYLVEYVGPPSAREHDLVEVSYLDVVPGGETTDRIRNQFVEARDLTTGSEAAAWGESLVRRHGGLMSSSCSISIPGGCPIYDMVTGHVLPAWRMVPNQGVYIPDWPEGLDPVDWRITRVAWQQRSGTTTLATGRGNDLRRAIRQAAKEVQQSTQPGDTRPPYVVPQPDRPTSPIQNYNPSSGHGGGGLGSGGLPQPPVVPIDRVAGDLRVAEPQWSLPRDIDEVYGVIPYDCILIQVTGLAPVGQTGAAVQVVVARSTYANYGSRSNLTSLNLSGTNAKDRKMLEHQFFAGDIVYLSWAVPPAEGGYDFVTIALLLERR